MKTLIAYLAGTSIALLSLAGCTPTPEVSPSPTTAPVSDEPTPSPALEPVPEGRNPDMSDAEALLRAERVVTGETWLPAPVPIATPAWAAGVEMLSYEWDEWFTVGARGDADIVVISEGLGSFQMFEVDSDGKAVHVAEPSPMKDVPPDLSNWYGASIVTDGSIYYDSLATPATFTTPEGYVFSIRDMWGHFYPSGATQDLVGGVANVGVYRTESGIDYPEGLISTQGGLNTANLRHVAYLVRFPHGLWVPVRFDPLGLADGSAIIDASGIAVGPATEYVDLLDIHCGGEPLPQVLVLGQSSAQWTLVGSTDLGPLYAPQPTNPVAIERHAMYVDSLVAFGEDPSSLPGAASVADFIAHGALLGTPAPDGNGWFVQLNREFSPRAWC
ncbi:MAG: hypothetical protein CVT64_07190 [Actinobacteria bacterium HGW-Actinobacteria-4]|nr:MAG: hypothetical protein CVT64_07190 [Actinobacteria bacterium HGW-Actinobacteria-4]